MARRRALGRVGLLLLGALLGFALSLVVVYLLVDRWRTQRVEERVAVQLGLPDVAFDVEDVEEDGSLRIVLQNVAFLDSAGDTIVSAPRARARLLASSLNGDGPIVLDQGEVVRPYLRLIQRPDGEFNVFDIFAVEADGQPVRGAAGAGAEGRPIVFRGIRVVDGRARIALPYQPSAEAAPRFASTRQPERVRWGGRWYTLHLLSDLDATMNVRLAAGRGWRVEIGSASATVTNPDMRIAAFAGSFEERGDQVLRFDVNTFRTGRSSLDADGTITLGGEVPVYDVTVRAHPLAFADLQGMGFPIPREGTASFSLGIETLARNRTRWTVADANVAILGSRASGSLTAVTGPGAEPVFTNTSLALDPLRLSDLETLGFVDRLPLTGEVTGTIRSLDALEADRGGALRVDLAADLRPRDDPSAPPSVLAARGVIRVGTGENAIRFDGLRVEAEPVNLATFRALMPGREGLLRGTVRGGATLTGTMRAFRVEGGDLAYVVGDAPETRLRGLSGEVRLQPALSYTLQASADPLALATLTELFPALPFRSATLSGPIRISGNPERVAFDVDLSGAAGGIDAQGTLALGGAVLGFDVRGRLEAFRTAALLTSEAPLEGPVSGTFEARGTAEDFRFAVDLTQGELGRFALSGTVRRPGGSPAQFDVAGRLDNFRLGYLVGRPGLLPGPVSGPIRLSGGGRAPLRFDVELQGAGPRGVPALLDLEGWYLAGAVPRYAVTGRVAGIDLSGLPGMAALPRTRLTGAIAIEGQGTTPETFAGRIDFTASPGSTVGGIPLEAGVARVVSDGGVIRVDTLLFAVRGARLEARGAVGVERAAPEPLTFTFQAPDLAALRPLVPGGDTLPELAGAVALSGSLAGTVRAPILAANGTARGLRYGAWAAGTLDFSASGSKGARGWAGTARLQGTDVELAFGGQRFEALTLETNLTPDRASFGFTARRDAETDLAASGTLELGQPGVRGVILNTLDARIGGVAWTLAERARLAWSDDRGLEVENLLLRRTGAATGLIAADGVLPPRGAADFRFEVAGLDLRELRRLFPQLPDAGGIVTASGVIDGPVENPRLTLDARVDSFQYGGVTADSVALSARYADRRMVLGGGVRLGEREVLAFDASVPMSFTLGGIVPGFEVIQDGALTATIAADSLPLALVAQTFPQVSDAAGVARARVEVRGTPADPTVSGQAALENGALTVAALGARWERINGSLSLQGEEIRIDSLTARTGSQGWASVSGSVLLDDPSAPAVNLGIRLEDFQVIDNPEVASLESTADVRLSGRLPGVEATGSVRIEDGEIQIPEFGADQELDIVDADVGQIGADTIRAPVGAAALLAAIQPRELNVAIGESVWLESPDARIQITGDLIVDRVGGATVVFGEARVVRGVYTLELGPIEREFEIREGTVQFFGTPELNPRIDIVAAHEVRSLDTDEPLTVLVRLGGTLQNPTVELTSDTRPPLPQAEIASLLLTGRRIAQLSGLPQELAQGILFEEALGSLLTNTLEETLIRSGWVDFIRVRTRSTASAVGRSGSSFGLDFLGAVSLEVGKEVTDNVFATLELANFLSDRPSLGGAVEWEVSRTLRVRGAYEPVRRDPLLRNLRDLNYQATVEVRGRWEYGRPPEQPAPETPRRDPEEPVPGQPSTPTGEPPPPPPGTPRDEETISSDR